jgi:hypothetical protein
MSRFWLAICLVLLTTFLVIAYSVTPPEPRTYFTRPSALQRLEFHVVTGVLVGVVWAIWFRPQLEKGRISLLALFVLAALQAIYLALVRVMDPWH